MTTLPSCTDPEDIYVVDTANMPLMVMAASQVHAQKLWHRGVMVLVTDSKRQLVLRHRQQSGVSGLGIWDVMGSGHVGHDESYTCAVERLLPAELQRLELPFYLRHVIKGRLGTGKEFTHVHEVRLSRSLEDHLISDHQFLFVDHDELKALMTNYPDQLSMNLVHIWSNQLYNF
ncbi:MAG: hypothetical protein RBR42_12280 [Desulfomicrobium sp.]|jgi:isopentenyl-diphosphate delta-isomerase|nr:hypothetical protein [Desulfomicrobium sp.]NLV96197.1 hypothetical protein [Desulfovibrionales bacterium]